MSSYLALVRYSLRLLYVFTFFAGNFTVSLSLNAKDRIDVYGLAQGVVDRNFHPIERSYIDSNRFKHGQSFLITQAQYEKIATDLEGHPSVTSKWTTGGSSLNSLFHLARLGSKASVAPLMGDDEAAHKIENQAKRDGLDLELSNRYAGVTRTVVCLVQDDSERTMPVLAEDAIHRESPIRVNQDKLARSKFLLIEAYLFTSEKRTDSIVSHIRSAGKKGVRTLLTFSDLGPVHEFRKRIEHVLIEAPPYYVFASEKEVMAFTRKDDLQEAIRVMSSYGISTLVLTAGERGSRVIDMVAKTSILLPAVKTTVVDSTGAGDIYVAGFLYGLVHDWNLEKSGSFANYIAAAKLKKHGPHLDTEELRRVLAGFGEVYS